MNAPVERLILVLNAGSSSIKFGLFDASNTAPRRVHSGAFERIGHPHSMLRVDEQPVHIPLPRPDATPKVAATASPKSQAASGYVDAAQAILNWIEQHTSVRLLAVGHRVAHGGEQYTRPQLLNPAVLGDLRALSAYAPEHLPSELALIEAAQRRFPGTPQVACFDTAFHHNLPRCAQLLPIPRRYQKQGVRRYGFHGLSYEFLSQELVRLDGADADQGRVVFAHLGSGASLAAVYQGQPIDTTMGFTPSGGVPMGTRSGDVDPGLLAYLSRTEGQNADQVSRMLNQQSGLLGVSETSSDVRELLNREASDPRAQDALALFCYQIKKAIGGLAAALGGLDTLVFSGGIGEHSAAIRQRICAGLSVLGVELSDTLNGHNGPLISSTESKVKVRVIPTNEALMIARNVSHLILSKPALESNP